MQRRRSLDDLQRSYAAFLRLRQLTEWTSRSRRLLAGKSSAKADLGYRGKIRQQYHNQLTFSDMQKTKQLLGSKKIGITTPAEAKFEKLISSLHPECHRQSSRLLAFFLPKFKDKTGCVTY